MSINQKARILIIDKTNGGTYLLGTNLQKWGFEVFTVNSFLKAIDYTQGSPNPPTLVIVEVNESSAIFLEFPRKFE